MRKLTEKEKKVLEYLKEKEDFVSPTQIGKDVGGRDNQGYWRHSSWASPVCLRLVKKELVKRNNKGHYKIKEGCHSSTT